MWVLLDGGGVGGEGFDAESWVLGGAAGGFDEVGGVCGGEIQGGEEEQGGEEKGCVCHGGNEDWEEVLLGVVGMEDDGMNLMWFIKRGAESRALPCNYHILCLLTFFPFNYEYENVLSTFKK